MADVAPAERTRGQMILVGAFALALVFVAFATLLNSVIYTGNIATQDTNHDTAEAVEFHDRVDHTATTIAARAETGAEFGEELTTWGKRAGRLYASKGVQVSIGNIRTDTDGSMNTGIYPIAFDIEYRGSTVDYWTTVRIDP